VTHRAFRCRAPGPHDVLAFERAKEGAGKPGGISHFGFRLVDAADIDAAVAEVERAGGKLLRLRPRSRWPRDRDLVRMRGSHPTIPNSQFRIQNLIHHRRII
jgi:hypothetical protein